MIIYWWQGRFARCQVNEFICRNLRWVPVMPGLSRTQRIRRCPVPLVVPSPVPGTSNSIHIQDVRLKWSWDLTCYHQYHPSCGSAYRSQLEFTWLLTIPLGTCLINFNYRCLMSVRIRVYQGSVVCVFAAKDIYWDPQLAHHGEVLWPIRGTGNSHAGQLSPLFVTVISVIILNW